ncbi:hypothetical protein C9925_02175 [cyanobacterium G8-9]|nr:hypothetical protein C9925_02175 [cyanobacterium G8-9]
MGEMGINLRLVGNHWFQPWAMEKRGGGRNCREEKMFWTAPERGCSDCLLTQGFLGSSPK